MSVWKDSLAMAEERDFVAIRSEWDELLDMAKTLVESGFLPKAINTPQKCVAVIMKGRELGIPTMQALAHIHIVDGKPTLSAELMLSLILEHPEADIEFVQNDAKACVIRVGDRLRIKGGAVSFTISDAADAQLLGRDNWKKYPRAMLRSRAISEMARTYFADVISGVSYTPEELAGDRAVMDSEGQLIELRPVDKPVSKKRAAPITQVPAKVLEFKDPGEKVMPDEPRAWIWLEGRMDDLPEDQKDCIRLGAVGRTVRELMADIEAARVSLVLEDAAENSVAAQ